MWFTFEKDFHECDTYWWSVFTLTMNFFPSYMIANEGCFFWGWFVCCEMQLFILLPWVVILMKKCKPAFQILMITVLTFASMGVIFAVVWENNFAAGLFAPQDIQIFKGFVNKPYTKLHCLFLGIGFAFLYNSAIKPHRKLTWPLAILLYMASIAVIGFVTLYPLEAQKHPMLWSKLHNSLFISMSRPAFLIGLALMLIPIFCNKGDTLGWFWRAYPHQVMAKLSYATYLIAPIAVGLRVSSIKQSQYLSYSTMLVLMSYNIVVSFLMGLVFYLLVEAPFRKFFKTLMYQDKEIKNSLSHLPERDSVKLVMQKYVAQQRAKTAADKA